MQCSECRRDFVADRDDAITCGNRCRQARFRRLHRKSPREKAALPVAQALHGWIEIEKQRPERDRSEDLPAALALYTALEGRK